MTFGTFLLALVLLTAPGAASADETASLRLESTLYFADLEGGQIEVAAGDYAVTSSAEGQLTLAAGDESHVIAADEAVHLEEIETASASLSEFEGEFILRLHFPDGGGRQALGSASGVGERGASSRAYDRGYCPRGFTINVSGSEARCRRKVSYWKSVGNPVCPRVVDPTNAKNWNPLATKSEYVPLAEYKGDENDQGWDLCEALGGTFKGPAHPCELGKGALDGHRTLVRRNARDLCRVRAWRWDYTNLAVRR